MWIPVHRSWRLNERHYGDLQGLNKAETAAKHGEAQVKIWRRSYDIPPPPLTTEDPRHPSHDRRYATLEARRSAAHRIAQGHRRAIPAVLARDDRSGHQGRQTRSDCRARQQPSRAGEVPGERLDEEIVELNIPTGIPLVYLLNDDLKPLQKFYLGDQAAAEAKAAAVANQGKVAVAGPYTQRRTCRSASTREPTAIDVLPNCCRRLPWGLRRRRYAATGETAGRWSSSQTPSARAAGGRGSLSW